MPAKRELESGLLDQPAMCTTVNSLHTGILETYQSYPQRMYFYDDLKLIKGSVRKK